MSSCAENSIGEGDSSLMLDVLLDELAQVAFDQLQKEVQWTTMYHRGGEVPRLVAVQGEVNDVDGSFPIYRHPADEMPPLHVFTPTVAKIRDHVQCVLHEPLNHVLIQLYRTGADFISEHSDKTADITRHSKIINVSLGAQRVMTLRLKRDGGKTPGEGNLEDKSPCAPARLTQKIALPHNSMFVLGPETNRKWLHGIRHDKRPLRLKTFEEQLFDGQRISLTFRYIGTFLTNDMKYIYGQGARGKTIDQCGLVVNGGEEAAKLLEAFGKENQESDFDWDAVYGGGYDVLDLKGPEGAQEGNAAAS